MNDSETRDPFAHLKRRASERADRTVERIRAGVASLRATGRKITAESPQADYERAGAGLRGLELRGDPSKPAGLHGLSRGSRRIHRRSGTCCQSAQKTRTATSDKSKTSLVVRPAAAPGQTGTRAGYFRS